MGEQDCRGEERDRTSGVNRRRCVDSGNESDKRSWRNQDRNDLLVGPEPSALLRMASRSKSRASGTWTNRDAIEVKFDGGTYGL